MWDCRGAGQEPPPGPKPPGPLPQTLEPPLGRKREAKGRGHEPRDIGANKEPQVPEVEEDLGFLPLPAEQETEEALGTEGLPQARL